jgi:hydrogenase maturation protease
MNLNLIELRDSMTNEARFHVIGLGSDHGDDRVGWEIVTRLSDSIPPGVATLITADPFSLITTPPRCELLIVIDACRGAGAPGTIHRFEWPDTQLSFLKATSTHGVGLKRVLELAESLGNLPPRVVILAVEADSIEPGQTLSSAALAAVPDVVRRVFVEIALGVSHQDPL